jgi:23S rRNA (adenine2030-N6)-methyltransferase
MLSYRHGFHAGSFIDVHKHVVLVMLLEHLAKKPAPFCFLDTHAGAGLYDLESRFAQKNREFETGVLRLAGATDMPDGVRRYLEIIAAANEGKEGPPRFYPGSPLIARYLMRPGDRLVAIELHNTEAPLLKAGFRGDAQAAVHHRDGYEALPALVPPAERRGLVLMDPAYEIRNEFRTATDALLAAWRKWPTGIYALWFPVQRRRPLAAFYRALGSAGMRKVLLNEMVVAPETRADRLTGSGLVIVNPPWGFEPALRGVMAWLLPRLEQGEHPPARVEWLVSE